MKLSESGKHVTFKTKCNACSWVTCIILMLPPNIYFNIFWILPAGGTWTHPRMLPTSVSNWTCIFSMYTVYNKPRQFWNRNIKHILNPHSNGFSFRGSLWGRTNVLRLDLKKLLLILLITKLLINLCRLRLNYWNSTYPKCFKAIKFWNKHQTFRSKHFRMRHEGWVWTCGCHRFLSFIFLVICSFLHGFLYILHKW